MTTIDQHLYPPGVQTILTILSDHDIQFEVKLFQSPAHTASQAADLLGCPLGAIVKSLVFQKKSGCELVLVLVSGKNRVDIDKLTALVGAQVAVAKPETVLSKTGYAVGAVPPIGIKAVKQTILDADLTGYEHIWASAGALNILMRLTPEDLCNLTNCQIEEIKQV